MSKPPQKLPNFGDGEFLGRWIHPFARRVSHPHSMGTTEDTSRLCPKYLFIYSRTPSWCWRLGSCGNIHILAIRNILYCVRLVEEYSFVFSSYTVWCQKWNIEWYEWQEGKTELIFPIPVWRFKLNTNWNLGSAAYEKSWFLAWQKSLTLSLETVGCLVWHPTPTTLIAQETTRVLRGL